VRLRQRLESQDPKLRVDTPADEVPLAWEVVQMHKRQILQAELECDWRFLRRLSDATKLVRNGQASGSFYGTATGYALAAWRQLYDELGHTPGRDQLKEYVDTLRRQEVTCRRFSKKGRSW
jgi:hypothetical protein